ncbi:bile acid:sodium symporter [Thiohalocapsa halophila]|uniref:Bile acid:sodium symporter n=1 Tax=Thiohalocapsa halophila TaxID=69359 RepID=A0ABS1CHD2_9GAMM|nr:bile acid:sodium symporter family protein [Thiohalocapsa halophila]MBK1631309.1 bile acid:sodium symporter [Thiohalocapsa halophila]
MPIRTGATATTLFPLWALLGSVLAYLRPDWLAPLKPAIVPLLGVVMFGMGVTLTWRQFAAVWQRPQQVGLGMALQFGVMPLAAWVIGTALGLPAALIAGLVLVGASPGGTASNVVCYLARGDVALSITLTAASTLLAVVATPLLTWLYVGQQVPVPVWDMLLSVAKIVLLPVMLGVAVNTWLGARLAPVKDVFPLLSMAAIVLIIAIIVALNLDNIAAAGWLIVLAVVLHNAVGLTAGYGLGLLVTRDLRSARTLAIEVGMQNSGLAGALAVQYFSAAAAIPGALFSIWHNLSGSALAALWSRRPLPAVAAADRR